MQGPRLYRMLYRDLKIREDACCERVSAALTKRGYSHTTDGTITPSFTEALKQYQKDNGLAIGQISYETLEVLAIRKI